MFQAYISFFSLVGAHIARTYNTFLGPVRLLKCCFYPLQSVPQRVSCTFRWRLMRAEGAIDD